MRRGFSLRSRRRGLSAPSPRAAGGRLGRKPTASASARTRTPASFLGATVPLRGPVESSPAAGSSTGRPQTRPTGLFTGTPRENPTGRPRGGGRCALASQRAPCSPSRTGAKRPCAGRALGRSRFWFTPF